MPRKKKQDESVASKPPIELAKMNKTPQLIKGMKDILPQDQSYWLYIRKSVDKIAYDYGFERIDTPVTEELSLFTHSIGKQTDVVEKEMYSFVDQGGNTIAMRPEFTAGIARAYLEHGMAHVPQPVKLYTQGPLFRYDKPQEGRYRQFFQFDCEIIGEAKPSVDAQLILIAFKFYTMIGLTPVLHINSIGCLTCRGAYRDLLSEYFRSKRSSLCEDCKRRLVKNPLRLLDCKQETCEPIKLKAPHVVDSLCDPCRDHFMGVLEYIDDFEIPYQHDPYLVRGLDYYTRTVFEFFIVSHHEGAENKPLAIGGGGRYDNLIEVIGGPSTPACGFAMGIERLIIEMKKIEQDGKKLPFDKQRPIDIFVAQLGEQAKRRAMIMYEDLLKEGFSLAESFTKDSLKAQLELANKLGAKFSLILGEKERTDGTIIIRNMEGGEQEVVDSMKLIPILHRKLEVPVTKKIINE